MHVLKHFLAYATAILFAIIIHGCSAGDQPVTPVNPENPATLPVMNLSGAGGVFEATGLLSSYDLTIDTKNMISELVPKRNLSIGESYIVSGIGFFTITPCATCLKIKRMSLSEQGYPILTFSLNHPFKPGNTSQPPSAINRLDLDIFDVELIVVPTQGSSLSAYPLTGSDIYSSICVNPDGYTTELARMLNVDAAMPYFLAVDESEQVSHTWNEFPMGATNVEFDTDFNLSAETLLFDLYLTFGYGASAKKMQRLDPKYYNPEFNRKAAWKVDVIPPEGSNPPAVGNTWTSNDSTTAFPVTVKVYDWQTNAIVYATPDDFANAPSDNIYSSSNVSSVSAEIPGMNNTLQTVNTPDSGTGMPTDPLIFTLNIANENLLPGGSYAGLVKVTDDRPAGVIPLRDYLIDVPNGINITNYELTEFATYQTFTATVVTELLCGPISGSITDPPCPVTGVSSGASINFSASASSAQGGDPIVLYEWDSSYDGVTFNAEYSGQSVDIGPFENPNCPNPIPVSYTVAVRATDSCVPPNVTIIATCEVTVDNCCADQELFYDFAGCGSPTGPVVVCQGWQAGGCGLPNASNSMGAFKWGCDVGSPCGMTYPYALTGGGTFMGGDLACDYIFAHGSNADFNLVSPSITLPSSSDGTIEFDHCNAFALGATYYLYISENGCSGPWIQIWSTTNPDGCFNNTTVDLSSYSGSDVMFRFRYQSAEYIVFGGSCGENVGVILDDIRISGCFSGTLAEN